MAVAPIYLVLLIAVITRCNCDHSNGYSANIGNGASQIGELLKPPPPPSMKQILPVPFHGGTGRTHRQNLDIGYQYQPPLPPLLPPLPPSSEFKFPSPFYKHYNFNFVPPPQPFTTTPSPSLFQKVSGWLFPSQQTSYDTGTVYTNNIAVKKDCNPCNLVPWLPVIRYNLGSKNVQQNPISTYGPPSPTANADSQNVAQYRPQHFNNVHVENKPLQLSPGVPYANYGPPKQTFNSNSIGLLSSTYGPPSPTQTIYPQNIQSSTFSGSITPYPILSSSFGLPETFNSLPSSSYLPSSSHGVSSTSFNIPSSTFKPPTYSVPSSPFESSHALSTTYGPVTPHYEPGVLNNELPQQTGIENLDEIEPANHLKLPKVSQPTGFKNSYGETITDPKIFNIPYPVSATAAESTKIKTEVLPEEPMKPNISLALANPAPFTSNRGRNIHTLQPVALPNLSVSPLPPIFNARPFRPIKPQFLQNVLQGINQMQPSNNVNIQQSVSLAEFTHSVDYPTTFIQSPVIDIDSSSNINHTKAFRNIPDGYIVDEIRDISSQASEDHHVSATKSHPDSSFESTGVDVGNEIYDKGLPVQFSQNTNINTNHKPNFADLRGIKDEDVDKYRTESNLQNIDSPLLYLKPSAPHKEHGNFFFAISTPIHGNEYEIYDDIPSTTAPQIPTLTSAWDESRTDYSEGIPPPSVHEDVYQPKIVQIIVPYTTGKKKNNNDNFSKAPQDYPTSSEDKYQARKVPTNTENSFIYTVTENYSTPKAVSDESIQAVTDSYNSDQMNPAVILNDLYDVKEPPFDIIKLQHTIDDWTEQEYSKENKIPQKSRNSEKYAKQIPDDFFTTTMPSNYITDANNYNYDFYDHEVSSSIQHSITDENNETQSIPRKEYNTIQRTKDRSNSGKHEHVGEFQKPYIYTAASSFRTTTTPAPWGKIQTSISPLTKEKVYVVTSKPWREAKNMSNEWYEVQPFESRKTHAGKDLPASDNLPFKSPRFMNRPSFGFTSGGKIESVKSDSSYGFSRSWYQTINELEAFAQHNSTNFPEVSQQKATTHSDEDIIATTAEPHRNG